VSINARPTAREMSIAIISLLLVLGGAFIAAQLTLNREPPSFPLASPCPELPCNMTPFLESQRLDLNRTFFTAWTALILITPALLYVLVQANLRSCGQVLASFLDCQLHCFLVHFYWSVFVMFGGDWSRIFDKVENGRRVTVPVFDTIFTLWWGIDVLLAWLIPSEKWLIQIQRVLVHISAFVLFLLGSVKEGELNGSNGKPVLSVLLES